MPPDPIPDNSPLALPAAVNGRSPASGTVNASLAGQGSPSDVKTGGDLAASRLAAAQKTLLTREQLRACGLETTRSSTG